MNDYPIPLTDYDAIDIGETPRLHGLLDFMASRPRLAILGVASALALSACSAETPEQSEPTSISQPSESGGQTPENSQTPESSGLRDPALAERALQIISSFEYGTLELGYGEAEDIGDDRGITAGFPGFCTASQCGGDLLQVVERLTELEPGNGLEQYIPALEDARDNDSSDDLEGLIDVWKQLGDDPLMQQAQKDVYERLYLTPALEYADNLGITTAAGQLVLLDTIVQHGDGEDEDSISAIITETLDATGPVDGNEANWIQTFLEKRTKHLKDPKAEENQKSADEWNESAPRDDSLWQIYGQDPTLTGRLQYQTYDEEDNFTLEPI